MNVAFHDYHINYIYQLYNKGTGPYSASAENAMTNWDIDDWLRIEKISQKAKSRFPKAKLVDEMRESKLWKVLS